MIWGAVRLLYSGNSRDVSIARPILLMVSIGMGGPGEGRASGPMRGTLIVVFRLLGTAVSLHEVERETGLTIDDITEGSMVLCIGLAAVPSAQRWPSKGAR
jgi:hypothetical protein